MFDFLSPEARSILVFLGFYTLSGMIIYLASYVRKLVANSWSLVASRPDRRPKSKARPKTDYSTMPPSAPPGSADDMPEVATSDLTYDILHSGAYGELRKKVSRRMAEGWVPCGSVAVVPREHNNDGQGIFVFHQAIYLPTYTELTAEVTGK